MTGRFKVPGHCGLNSKFHDPSTTVKDSRLPQLTFLAGTNAYICYHTSPTDPKEGKHDKIEVGNTQPTCSICSCQISLYYYRWMVQRRWKSKLNQIFSCGTVHTYPPKQKCCTWLGLLPNYKLKRRNFPFFKRRWFKTFSTCWIVIQSFLLGTGKFCCAALELNSFLVTVHDLLNISSNKARYWKTKKESIVRFILSFKPTALLLAVAKCLIRLFHCHILWYFEQQNKTASYRELLQRVQVYWVSVYVCCVVFEEKFP